MDTSAASPAALKAVSFDAAGTLFEVREPVGETYARIAAVHHIEVCAEQLAQAFRAVYPAMPPLAFGGVDGELDRHERAWWRELLRRAFGAAAGARGFDSFFDEVYEHFAGAAAWRVYPEVATVLQALGRLGVPCVVTSNFDTRLLRVLAGLQLAGYFEAVICSSTAGAAKPERAIFECAAAALSLATTHIIHAGDDARADRQGALGAGMRAMLVHRGAPQAMPDGAVPTLLPLLELWR